MSKESEQDKLERIFGEKVLSESSIMLDAERIYEYQKSIGNAYAFTVAYDWAKRQLKTLEDTRILVTPKNKD